MKSHSQGDDTCSPMSVHMGKDGHRHTFLSAGFVESVLHKGFQLKKRGKCVLFTCIVLVSGIV